MQAAQSAWASHGSEAAQAEAYQTQSAHDPELGPPLPPVAQVPVVRHQPQVRTELHDAQSAWTSHGSVLDPHELAYQLQPEAQVPVVGPARVPVMQVAVAPHQPQLARPVQSAQRTASAQGSVAEPVVQASSVQVNPAQQSPVAVHKSEPTWQAQWPETHDIQPQQSRLEVHAPPASAQHWASYGAPRQLNDEQHSEGAAHGVRTGPQEVELRTQRLAASHSSPVRHGAPEVQQGWPSAPQVALEHLPPLQVPSQGVPQEPQFRGSRAVSTHAPAQQVAPAAVQVDPEQQGWPRSPQAAGAVWQVPPVQTRPALQAVPPQHGSRAPPQAAAVSQTPAVQTRPEAQAIPEQHGWRRPPQAATGTHVSRSHTRPDRHAPPAQHGCRSAPHAGSAPHVPPEHTSSSAQAMPEQQGWPSRPQAAAAVQVPATQVNPGPHPDPAQHGSRSCPQRADPSGVAVSPASSRASRGTSRITVSSPEGAHASASAAPARAAACAARPVPSRTDISASLPAGSGLPESKPRENCRRRRPRPASRATIAPSVPGAGGTRATSATGVGGGGSGSPRHAAAAGRHAPDGTIGAAIRGNLMGGVVREGREQGAGRDGNRTTGGPRAAPP